MNGMMIELFYNLIYCMIKLIIKVIKWEATISDKWKLLQKFRKIKIIKRFNS